MAFVVPSFTSAIADSYDGLKALIADYLDRSDLDAAIPAFIEMAHRKLDRSLLTPDREALYAVSAGDDFDLPEDFRELRELSIAGSPNVRLAQVPLYQLHDPRVPASGTPRWFAIARGMICLAPRPDCALDFRMTYLAAIPLLGPETPSNWVLERHPDLYVYAALAEAYAYLKDGERAAAFLQAAQQVVADVVDAGNRWRNSAAPIAMRPEAWA